MNIDALKFPQFRMYLLANIISLHGLWIQRITVGWIAWDLTGSASFVGFVAFLGYLPNMLTGPIFGVLIDRINIRNAAIVSQSLFCLIGFVAYVLQVNALMTPSVLAGLALVVGVVTSAQLPIRMSLTPRLVPKSAVGSVVVLVALNFNLARVVGPAIGGLIISTAGVKAALLVAALAYLPAIATMTTLKPRARQQEKNQKSLAEDFIAGLRFIQNAPLISQAILITGLFSLTARSVLEILPTIADGGFAKGAVGLGTLSAAAGAGALVAAIAQSFAPPPNSSLPKTALIAAFAGPLFVLLLGSTQIWSLALIAVAMLGFVGTIVGVAMQTGIQVQLDDGMRGRVMSLWVMVALGATAAGSVGLGLLVDLLGLQLALQFAGGASALLILWLIRRG